MSHPRKKISLLKPNTFFKIAEALKCADIMSNGCSKRRGKEVTALFIVFKRIFLQIPSFLKNFFFQSIAILYNDQSGFKLSAECHSAI